MRMQRTDVAWAAGSLGRVRLVFGSRKGQEALGSLPQLWFGPKPFERSCGLHERLGVRGFKRFVPFGDPANRLVRALFFPDFGIVSGVRSARAWVLFTVPAGGFHVLLAALFVAFTVPNLLSDEYARAAWELLANLIVNVYPAMVQRYNRIRLLGAFGPDLEDAHR